MPLVLKQQGRMEVKNMEMRERIHQKAEELFHRYGIRSITMDEIASQLGISKKTIYQSFNDKDELVSVVFGKYMAKSKEWCLSGKENAKDAIHEIFLDLEMLEEMVKNMNPYLLYDLEKYHPKIFKKFYEYKNEFLYQVIVKNLKWGVETGLYRPDINIEIISRFRIGSIMVSLNRDIFPDNNINIVEVEQHLLLHYLHGIASLKGLKLIEKYSQKH